VSTDHHLVVILVLPNSLANIVIQSTWPETQKLCEEIQKRKGAVGTVGMSAGSKKKRKRTTAKSGVPETEGMNGGFMGIWKVIGTHEFNQMTLKTYQQKAQGRRSTLIFCANLAVVRDLTTKFKQAGIKAESVSNKTTPFKRSQIITAFKQQELDVLVNCEVLTEGADLPSVRPCYFDNDLSADYDRWTVSSLRTPL
jgi:superfamily II DNA/RNA helicase